MLEIINQVASFILHIDVHLGELIAAYGVFTHVILFIIVFCETGLVFTPFLPGDSLLFAAGAFAALGSLSPIVIFVSLTIAAVLGDTVNYWVGYYFGQKIIENPKLPINHQHIEKTNKFFAKHGGKTIILARFVPLVRTFAPFVAGVGKMNYSSFVTYNVVGAIIWVGIFTFAGYYFGQVPLIKHNFSLIIIVIIALSVVPVFYHLLADKFRLIKKSVR